MEEGCRGRRRFSRATFAKRQSVKGISEGTSSMDLVRSKLDSRIYKIRKYEHFASCWFYSSDRRGWETTSNASRTISTDIRVYRRAQLPNLWLWSANLLSCRTRTKHNLPPTEGNWDPSLNGNVLARDATRHGVQMSSSRGTWINFHPLGSDTRILSSESSFSQRGRRRKRETRGGGKNRGRGRVGGQLLSLFR